jgi:hypothetical protein
MVTVPVTTVSDPPTTVDGEIWTAVGCGGITVRLAVALVPYLAAVIVAVTSEDTASVSAVNVSDFDPPGIVTESGTLTQAADDARATVRPPAGAFADNVAVKVTVLAPPPSTVVGLTVSAKTL